LIPLNGKIIGVPFKIGVIRGLLEMGQGVFFDFFGKFVGKAEDHCVIGCLRLSSVVMMFWVLEILLSKNGKHLLFVKGDFFTY
jgi:hypothetical protein